MAKVEDCWHRTVAGERVRSARYGQGLQWRARWRDQLGEQRAKSFRRKIDAEQFLAEVVTDLRRGSYVDPRAGKVTLREYGEQWRAGQVHRPSTVAHVETMLRRHVYPHLGHRQLGQITPSEVQAWVKGLSVELAPATVKVVHGIVAGVFNAAVQDKVVTASPCSRTKLPKAARRQVVPLETEAVESLAAGIDPRLRALVMLAAGTGMRSGECFGLTLDRIDFLRRTVTVDRQLVLVPGRAPFLAEPKTEASQRTIPLPVVVVDELAAHLASHPAGPDGFVFTDRRGEPLRRTSFSATVWSPARKAAGLPATVRFHDLRHYYASLLIRHGESVKTVQVRLGHASASETLDTYSHLWPDSDDRTREAVDHVLGVAQPNLGVVSE
jgi:integrase